MLRSKFKIFYFLIFFCCILYNCRIIKDTPVLDHDSFYSQNVIDDVFKNNVSLSSLQIRRGVLKLNSPDFNFQTRFVIKNLTDSAILIHILPMFGIEAGRVLFTIDSITAIDRINRRYLLEDFYGLSERVGVMLEYSVLEDLLKGNLPNALKNYQIKNEIAINSNNFTSIELITPSNSNLFIKNKNIHSFEKIYLSIDILSKKIREMVIYFSDNRYLKVHYPVYSLVDDLLLPKNIEISYINDDENFYCDIEYNLVDLNKNLEISFPSIVGLKKF